MQQKRQWHLPDVPQEHEHRHNDRRQQANVHHKGCLAVQLQHCGAHRPQHGGGCDTPCPSRSSQHGRQQPAPHIRRHVCSDGAQSALPVVTTRCRQYTPQLHGCECGHDGGHGDETALHAPSTRHVMAHSRCEIVKSADSLLPNTTDRTVPVTMTSVASTSVRVNASFKITGANSRFTTSVWAHNNKRRQRQRQPSPHRSIILH